MNLETMTVAVRERSLFELYDLALLLIRRHPLAIAVLIVGGAAPFAAFDIWLLHGASPEWPFPMLWWWLFLLLLAVQGPLATAPLSAWLGECVFTDRPSLRRAFGTALRHSWSLLLFGLWRLLLALPAGTLVLFPAHIVEVALLERQPLGASWARAHALRSAWMGTYALHLLIALVLTPIVVLVAANTLAAIAGALARNDPWEGPEATAFVPGVSVVPILALFLFAGYLAVVRFAAYLDLRTRREGWEIDLGLRRAARRIAGDAS